MWGGGGLLGVGLAVTLTVVLTSAATPSGPRPSSEVPAPPVIAGAPDAQPAALVVANTTGIPGVVAYDTTGWPAGRDDGPAAQALGHAHVDGRVVYSVIPPVGGDHSPIWLNCGVYDQPVPNEHAVHDLEHGAVWITYRPSLPAAEVRQLQAFEARQSLVGATGSRYVDVSPYRGLSSPIVISSWGFQLRVSSPTDSRLQRFVDAFRASSTYAPEPGGECTGGLGTPLGP
ncbi:MAG: DUF3105 domain-containing protein [Actinomycetes bacterium]